MTSPPRNAPPSKPVTNVYVDGFNLYYGCLKGSPYKWLNLEQLCARLLPHNRIRRIRYSRPALAAARTAPKDLPGKTRTFGRLPHCPPSASTSDTSSLRGPACR